MKSKIRLSYNERLGSKNIDILLNNNLTNENKLSSKQEFEQILFNRKSSLDVLLHLIKSFQSDYFSKKNEANKIKPLKQIIYSLQNNLSLMLSEKKKQFDYLTIKKENNKKRIRDVLFPETKTKKVNNFEIKDKLKELKLINFQIENEIKKTRLLIEQKNQNYFYQKSIPFLLDKNYEIFCNTKYENLENITDILKTIKKSIKEKFISVVKEKMETELEINAILFKIESLKENIVNNNLNSNRKYIDTEEIIYEDTKEDNKTIKTNQSKRNSFASLNKLNTNKKFFDCCSKNMVKKSLSIDSMMKDNIYQNKIFALSYENNEFFKENKNQINNYLNMNINVNINVNNGGFNKPNYSSSSDEEDDYLSNDDEDQFEIELDDNNKIIVSPIQTKEDVNDNENDIISNQKDKGNSYKFPKNNKEMMKLYNKPSDDLSLRIKNNY